MAVTLDSDAPVSQVVQPRLEAPVTVNSFTVSFQCFSDAAAIVSIPRTADFTIGNWAPGVPVEGEDGARVMWLGLPQVRSPSLEKKLTLIRGIHEERVGELGDEGIYLDTTQYLVDGNGKLLQTAEVKAAPWDHPARQRTAREKRESPGGAGSPFPRERKRRPRTRASLSSREHRKNSRAPQFASERHDETQRRKFE